MNEANVNGNISDLDNQYIIKSDWKIKDMGLDFTTIGPLAKTAKEEYPNLVQNYYRYNPVATVLSVVLAKLSYRIQQNAIPYFPVAAFVFITAFVLITAQCFEAAMKSPVKSLRSE